MGAFLQVQEPVQTIYLVKTLTLNIEPSLIAQIPYFRLLEEFSMTRQTFHGIVVTASPPCPSPTNQPGLMSKTIKVRVNTRTLHPIYKKVRSPLNPNNLGSQYSKELPSAR